jgi:hypothetical protein
MYLRTVFELEEEGIVPLRARIAERLSQSGPTVSQTVARMERDGLLHVAGDRQLALTDAGRTLAMRVRWPRPSRSRRGWRSCRNRLTCPPRAWRPPMRQWPMLCVVQTELFGPLLRGSRSNSKAIWS